MFLLKFSAMAALINVTFILPDGRSRTLQGTSDDTLMDVAVDNGVEGIIAQCGGGCTCCTCHCWIKAPWTERLPPASLDEAELLTYAIGYSANSRLACQVRLRPDLDGIVATIPAETDW
tara:strand:- start:748 stop:1104 length:357 start_codon:yes stop_codon:yes gene_type:complete